MTQKKMKRIEIMPFIQDHEEFKKYLLKVRKELKINFSYDIKDNSLTINDLKIYFYDIRSVMAYLEGIKVAKDIENKNK